MIKLDIVKEVVNRTGITKTRAAQAVETVFESMKKALNRSPGAPSRPIMPMPAVFGALHPRGRFKGKQLVEMRVAAYDPTRPIGSWRTAWRTLTKRARLPGLRFHDTRHQAVTEMLEGAAGEGSQGAGWQGGGRRRSVKRRYGEYHDGDGRVQRSL